MDLQGKLGLDMQVDQLVVLRTKDMGMGGCLIVVLPLVRKSTKLGMEVRRVLTSQSSSSQEFVVSEPNICDRMNKWRSIRIDINMRIISQWEGFLFIDTQTTTWSAILRQHL
jgi:hypothetical protein